MNPAPGSPWPEVAVDNDPDTSFNVERAIGALGDRLWLLLLGPLLCAVAAWGVTFLIAPTYTASLTLLPPQPPGASSSALASLGSLASLAGGGLRTPADQYVALMQSRVVADRIVKHFDLVKAYDVELFGDAREKLRKHLRITANKKDGLIVVEVDDASPQRAADIANRHVEELRDLTSRLSITEAQQRREFFEKQMVLTKDRLVVSQQALQDSGFSQGALRVEPRLAAEGYAKLKAETTGAEMRLEMLRRSLADGTLEVRQQQGLVSALRSQLAQAERSASTTSASPGDKQDYVGKYRDFKYQETLFDLYARQFELARVDESREGAVIQVVDVAAAPERPSRPRRAMVAMMTFVVSLAVLAIWVVIRQARVAARAASLSLKPAANAST